MAATIGVCEDRQDYELMEPSKTENPKRENRFMLNKLSFISTYLEHSQALFHTHSTPIQVANVQEFLSCLLRCLLMSCGVSDRCLTIVMQRMLCQRSTLRVGNLCYITAVITFRWMPLCSVALTPHVSPLAKYLTIAFEKIPKIPIPPTANTTYQFYPATALCT